MSIKRICDYCHESPADSYLLDINCMMERARFEACEKCRDGLTKELLKLFPVIERT